MEENEFYYYIDSNDLITEVSPNWATFADANSWDHTYNPEDIIGHPLWDFIEGIETQHLYMEIFKRVRSGATCQPIPFRCDSPGEHRYLELQPELLSDGRIKIKTRILKVQTRKKVDLLERRVPRSSDLIRICSVCKKIATEEKGWLEIEDGLALLKPFEAREMPGLTHGLCPLCTQEMRKAMNIPQQPNAD